MKHLKLFEDYKLKSTTVYHGTDVQHQFNNGGSVIPGSTFFAEDINVARGYGEFVYAVEIPKDLKIFDTLNREDIGKLFNEFDVLYDEYYREDEEGYEIKSVDEFLNL